MGHVLVVDDNVHNVRLLEARLQVAGYAVETAASGAEALAKVAADPPDLMLLDVMMPGIDGYEVCRRLRGEAATARLPVVLITALDGEGDKAAGRQAGADAFLTKPAPDDLLFPMLRRLLGQGA